jgi:peptidoglycan/xylan/chitin deacetylase (PgdA/CDA1 family)
MIRTKGNQNSIILLMHDASDKTQTVEALPEIIQYYKNEGYTFKTFAEIFD